MTQHSDIRQTPPIFVLHVAKGYEERAEHIGNMMHSLGLGFEFITDGDIPTLTPEVMERYFAPGSCMATPSAAVSCAYKHLLACEKIVSDKLDGALVLEDDIVLLPRFKEIFAQSLEELPDAPAIVNYEDTRLRFVPRSKRVKDRVLYPGDRNRFAGAYYVNREGAKAILTAAREEKLDRPIDLYHRHLLDNGKIAYLWCEPCIASQGSFNGGFSSSLSADRGSAAVWKAKRLYRRLLYWFR